MQAAQLVHHVHPDGRAPDARTRSPRGQYDEFVAEGMSEDAALLMRRGRRALIVAVEHARSLSAVTRLRRRGWIVTIAGVGYLPALVDAKGVSRLYEGRIRRRDMLFLVASAIAAMAVMIYASHSLHVFINGFRLVFRDTWDRVASWF